MIHMHVCRGLDVSNFLDSKARAHLPESNILESIQTRVPNQDLVLPTRVYKDKKRKSGTYTRTCHRGWIEKFQFVTYSHLRQGLFCLACVLIPVGTAHSGGRRARIPIEEPHTNWKDTLADIRVHCDLSYHTDSMVKM